MSEGEHARPERAAWTYAVGRSLPAVAIWIAGGFGLSQISGRVTDWFVMTDELLYERFAITSARAATPFAQVHGHATSSLNQLYPLLIAPLFRHGLVPSNLHRAHVLNAWVLSSACIPAYFLARRVTGRRAAAYVLAVASICVPWVFYASFLLTEVAAYPAFLWALLAMQRSVTTPSRRSDAMAIGGIALAFFARTQFAVLVAVLPLAIVAGEAGGVSAARTWGGAKAALRRAVTRHRMLAIGYALAAVGVLVLALAGRLHAALGSYGGTLSGGLPHGLGRSLLEHLATLSLGLGILPVVVGIAWFLATALSRAGDPERRAFACLGILTSLALLLEVAIFDLRLGVGLIVYDRYLFYLAPILLLGFLSAVVERARLRWSLVVAVAAVAAGFAVNVPPVFEWQQFATLSPDAPVSVLYRPLVQLAGGMGSVRGLLVGLTIALTVLFALVARSSRARAVVLAVTALCFLAIPAETGYVLHRLFGAPGWSDRALTAPASVEQTFTWVDQAVGTRSDVTMIPYHVSSAYLVSLRYWRDLEFWNKSANRNAYFADERAYRFTGNNFPRVALRVDPRTGAVNTSLTRYVVQSVTESRFRIAGKVQVQTQEAMLIDAEAPWRASWITSGASDDGWLPPDGSARIRIFPARHQTDSRIQSLSLQVSTADGVTGRPFVVASNLARSAGSASGGASSAITSLPVCVPAHGFADVVVRAQGTSTIPGDLSKPEASQPVRQGSIYLADISVSDDIGPRCGKSAT